MFAKSHWRRQHLFNDNDRKNKLHSGCQGHLFNGRCPLFGLLCLLCCLLFSFLSGFLLLSFDNVFIELHQKLSGVWRGLLPWFFTLWTQANIQSFLHSTSRSKEWQPLSGESSSTLSFLQGSTPEGIVKQCKASIGHRTIAAPARHLKIGPIACNLCSIFLQ